MAPRAKGKGKGAVLPQLAQDAAAQLNEQDEMPDNNLADMFHGGDRQIQRKRTDNLFKELDERQLTEEEQAIIEQRVALQRKLFQRFEEQDRNRKVQELMDVCPDLCNETAHQALEMCNWKEEEAAVRFTSDPVFRRKLLGSSTAQVQPEQAAKTAAAVAAAVAAVTSAKPTRVQSGVPSFPRPRLVDASALQQGHVFVGAFRGRLGPAQIAQQAQRLMDMGLLTVRTRSNHHSEAANSESAAGGGASPPARVTRNGSRKKTGSKVSKVSKPPSGSKTAAAPVATDNTSMRVQDDSKEQAGAEPEGQQQGQEQQQESGQGGMDVQVMDQGVQQGCSGRVRGAREGSVALCDDDVTEVEEEEAFEWGPTGIVYSSQEGQQVVRVCLEEAQLAALVKRAVQEADEDSLNACDLDLEGSAAALPASSGPGAAAQPSGSQAGQAGTPSLPHSHPVSCALSSDTRANSSAPSAPGCAVPAVPLMPTASWGAAGPGGDGPRFGALPLDSLISNATLDQQAKAVSGASVSSTLLLAGPTAGSGVGGCAGPADGPLAHLLAGASDVASLLANTQQLVNDTQLMLKQYQLPALPQGTTTLPVLPLELQTLDTTALLNADPQQQQQQPVMFAPSSLQAGVALGSKGVSKARAHHVLSPPRARVSVSSPQHVCRGGGATPASDSRTVTASPANGASRDVSDTAAQPRQHKAYDSDATASSDSDDDISCSDEEVVLGMKRRKAQLGARKQSQKRASNGRVPPATGSGQGQGQRTSARASAHRAAAAVAAAAAADSSDFEQLLVEGQEEAEGEQGGSGGQAGTHTRRGGVRRAAAAAGQHDPSYAPEGVQGLAAAAVAADAPPGTFLTLGSMLMATKQGTANCRSAVAISARGHTNRGRVKQKGAKRADMLSVGCIRVQNGWFNAGYIFPDGFKSRTIFRSSVELAAVCIHECSIVGEGGKFWPLPTFQVVAMDRPTEPLVAKSCTGCWSQVLKRINHEIEARRAAGEDLPPAPKTAIAGPEYFGFNQPEVVEAVEALDPQHTCTEYWVGKQDRTAMIQGALPVTGSGAGGSGSGAQASGRANKASVDAGGGGGAGGGRGGRRKGGAAAAAAEAAAEVEEAEDTYAGNRWTAIDRAQRYRRRCADAGESGVAQVDEENPLPGFLDPITLEVVINPAISPYGHVMGMATWRAVLSEHKRCPFTKAPLNPDQLVQLNKNNIERYRDRIKHQ